MRVELINWSQHNNLGDDAMTQVLLERIPGAINVQEHPTQNADLYILGGGTLISPLSLFPMRVPDPRKAVGISLGVSSNWNGEFSTILAKFKKIYTRDFFSHEALNKYGVQNELSVDLLCAHESPQFKMRQGIYANIMYTQCGVQNLKEMVDGALAELKEHKNVRYFAMSPHEDIETVNHAKVYDDARKLLKDLSITETVYATRLHANVLAWVAGVPDIRPIAYDPKVDHFFERVKDLTPKKAKKIIDKHLYEIISMI